MTTAQGHGSVYCVGLCPVAHAPPPLLPSLLFVNDEQYRCHPEIYRFPNEYFYRGKVDDAASVQGAGRARGWHDFPAFRPLMFYDLSRSAYLQS